MFQSVKKLKFFLKAVVVTGENSGDNKRVSVLQSALQSHPKQKIIFVSGSLHIE
jgi:hypothetical protein